MTSIHASNTDDLIQQNMTPPKVERTIPDVFKKVSTHINIH